MGWSGITKLYRIRAVLSLREDSYLYLEKPVRVDEVELRPTESHNKVIAFFTVRADSDINAMREAVKFIDNLCTAILLSKNIAVNVESIDIVEIQETSEPDSGRTKVIAIHEVIRFRDKGSIGLSLGETHLKNIIGIAGKIAGFKESVKRFLRWYRWGLLEDNPADRFIKLWIAFEIWAECGEADLLPALKGEGSP